jgi:hypothetical protein
MDSAIKLYFTWNNDASSVLGYTLGPKLLTQLEEAGYNTGFRNNKPLPERILASFRYDITQSDCLVVYSDGLDWVNGYMIAVAVELHKPIVYMTTPLGVPSAAIRGLEYDRIKFIYDVTESNFVIQLQYKNNWISSFKTNFIEEGPFDI